MVTTIMVGTIAKLGIESIAIQEVNKIMEGKGMGIVEGAGYC